MPQDFPNFYQANLKLLKIHHPDAWLTMTDTAPESLGEVYLTETGQVNLRLKKKQETIIMHHHETPVECGDNFLASVPKDSTAFVAILGMGLGYGALAIIKERPNIRHLGIFELNPGIFRQALQYVNLTALLSDPRVLLSVTPEPNLEETLAPARRALMLEDVHTLRHLPSFTFTKHGYKELNDQLFEIFNKANVEGNTNIYHGKTYLNNRFENMKTIHHDALIDKLANRFKGIPAIIVAGGPSLDKNIGQLKEAQNKAVIIAVDSTLPTLLAHNVTPHFITTIDPQDLIFEKFAEVASECKDTSIITMPWVSSKVTKVFPAKKIFWAFTASPIESWITKLLGGNIVTGGAATVAHLNLQAATILGCSPIIFMGQDLAYTDNKDHADNTALTHKETMDMAIGTKEGLIWSDSVTGGKVATNRSFFQMRCHFERMIKEASPSIEFINSTEGGVHIAGTTVLSLQESMQRYCRENKHVNERIHPQENDAWSPNPNQLLKAYKKLLKKIISVQQTIKANSQDSKYAIKWVNKLKKSEQPTITPQTTPPKLQEKIIDINNCHQELDKEIFLWRLMQEVTLAGIRESERKKQVIKTLENKPDKYAEWLLGSLKCLEEINDVRNIALEIFRKHISETIEFHHQESKLCRRIHNTEQGNIKDSLKLACHYYESGNIVLLDSVLQALPEETQNTAEIHFYRGIIAAYWTKYDEANVHFNTSLNIASIYEKTIRSFQEKLAEEYRAYGRNWIIDVKSRRRMLIKGLRYCHDYQPLIDDIQLLASEDVKIALDPSIAPSHLDSVDLIKAWCHDIDKNEVLRDNLLPSHIIAFYQQLIVLQQQENNVAGTLKSYSRILALTPDDATVHHNVASILFNIGEFQQGIKHLKKAVEIDKSYASFWENIGDFLSKDGQPVEAISAYEQYYTALPQNIGVLKKIGDCYLATDQLDAAKETYELLKTKMVEAAEKAA